MTMYFDSLYQLVDLWASGVDVSFYKWLCELYDNIVNLVHDSASGISTIPRFKPMSEVRCRGDRFAQIKDEAELAAEGRHRKEEETAKQLRAKVEQVRASNVTAAWGMSGDGYVSGARRLRGGRACP
eukprot:COSAG01_NODE_7897_length_3001_cov_10.758387_2_plen_127_part_00